jgi:hypothetical protein
MSRASPRKRSCKIRAAKRHESATLFRQDSVTRMKRLIRALGSIVLGSALFAGAAEAQGGGPPGGDIRAIVVAPGIAGVVYAGTTGAGVFRSDDRGLTWSAASTGLRYKNIQALAIESSNPSTLYAAGWLEDAGGWSEVYKSTNGGTTWTAVNSGLEFTLVSALAIDPNNSSTIYAGTCLECSKA